MDTGVNVGVGEMTKERENEIKKMNREEQKELLFDLRRKIMPQGSAPYQTAPTPFHDAKEIAETGEEIDLLEELLRNSE